AGSDLRGNSKGIGDDGRGDTHVTLASSASKSSETASALRESVSSVSREAAELASLKQSSLRRDPVSPDPRACADVSERFGAERQAGATVDLYSGVGTIGLTIGGDHVTLVESNEHAVREMERNIKALGRENSAKAILAPSESALEHITGDATIIVDPPRAGLHQDVVDRLVEVQPERIIYLSCNPVTQARDVARLCADGTYGIRHHRGYNFFPRTPHIEHLVVLDKK
ncbi:MAG TPA: RsmD family RNA methyltransferase, partial [Candidatus Saccharimonadaceae bacterium]|nr:RsmD family RNA methyltransferase [Candidatus Saccharimonadaceae bacterium]